MTIPRKRVLSGMQPSGLLHLGNYLGALETGEAFRTSSSAISLSRTGTRSRRITPIPVTSENSSASC